MIRRISERKSVVSACDEDICHLTVVLCVPGHILLCCQCCPNSSARILGLNVLKILSKLPLDTKRSLVLFVDINIP